MIVWVSDGGSGQAECVYPFTAPGSSLADKAPAVTPDVDNNGLYYWADDEDEVDYDYDYSYDENEEA